MTIQEPLFSFIIPCYNHGSFLRRCIKSVQAIEGMPYEMIIIDDGSKDETTITELKALSAEGYHVIRQENAGPGAARNNGIRSAKGKYIVTLDADDMIRKEYVYEAHKILESEPEISIVYSNYQQFGGVDTVQQYGPYSLQELLLANTIGSCVIYRKKAWEIAGGYDESLHKEFGWEDWDLWINFAYHNLQFRHIDIIGYDYYYHETSRERTFLKDKTKVNKIIGRFEEKYTGFFNPKAIHEHFLSQFRRLTLGISVKIVLAAFFPKYYNKLVAKGKIRRYLF